VKRISAVVEATNLWPAGLNLGWIGRVHRRTDPYRRISSDRKRVDAIVDRPVNPGQPGCSTSRTALLYKRLLEEVNDRGIVESFSSEIEVLAANTFYPWTAALSLRLIEDQ
jgi:hypothetical protein